MFSLKLGKINGSGFVLLIAVMFVAFGLMRICLGIFGLQDTAMITDIRRQGGERNEAVPNRYTFSISYSFTTAEGRKIDGFTYSIGSPVYIKPSASRPSMVAVRYLEALPAVNALDSDSGLKPGNIILILTGVFIIRVLKPKKSKNAKRKGMNP